ncbi:hypothetical protein QNI19_32015 [Cytophagaceae bacterium DM2B3-1]|uniref:Uncharacterized protein n=1 Tax=Xanthocytophaga flava TaxID=3048013 RepID=A0ABT7CV15_9BACT|nr:hypothetical protein [Xanthocytophaga flavus]MDJ1497609.1 hypothetical protein [Xanthocytophaga flavus]
MNDDPYYYQYQDRTMQQMSGGLASVFVGALIGCLYAFYYFIVYLPIVLAAYLASEKAQRFIPMEWYYQLTLGVITAYLLYSLIYFLKGLLIGLKERKNLIWVILLLICISITCFVPVMAAKTYAMQILPKFSLHLSSYWHWGIALFFGLLAYREYNFLENSCYLIVRWPYSLGLSISANPY